ncbi:MAG: DUF4339 domain-containing protein [Verrucomicrobiaceae bacterium]|nr:DUF4339 domain-containing protein [Verrucomicrobiaceae bacterium]
MNTWFYSDTQQTYGPITTEQLIAMIQAGQLVAGHFIMPYGAQEWQALGASPFAGYLPPAAPPVAAPAARPGPPAQRPAQPRSASAHHAPMPVKKKSPWVAIAAVLALAAAGGGYFWTSTPPSWPAEVKLSLVNLDAHSVDDNARFGIELLHSSEFIISSNRPVSVKKIPTGVIAPFYAELKNGPPESQRTHCLLIDGVGTPNPKGYLDSNANDDLTDDPVCLCKIAPDYRKDGSQDIRIYALLELKSMGTEFQAQIGCLVPCKKGGAPENLYLNGWYARTGSVRIQDKEIGALMLDDRCTGDFSHPTCNFGLDLNGDGKFRYQDGEVIFVGDHFNVNGTIYELSGLTPSGDSFRLTQIETLIGELAPSFEANTLSGEKISMPSSYRGKIVLVHFWGFEGTRAHQDLSVIKLVYEKHHTAGLEVLGECWSHERRDKRIAFLQERQMPWPQAEEDDGILKLFRINSVTNVLIDGDSGKILAIGFHGSGIEPAVAKALAEKKR